MLEGPNASVAVAALGKMLLDDTHASVSEIMEAARKSDTSLGLKVVAAEQSAQLRLRNSGLSLAELQPDVAKAVIETGVSVIKEDQRNTEGARDRQIRLQDNTNTVLGIGTSIAFFAIIGVLIFFGTHVEDGIKELLFTLLGVVSTGWANVMSYYFGTSAGSQQKTQAIASALLQSNVGSSRSPNS